MAEQRTKKYDLGMQRGDSENAGKIQSLETVTCPSGDLGGAVVRPVVLESL
jgi:hypothetical protein